MSTALAPDVVAELEAVGIYNADPEDELHKRLVAALYRTRGASRGNRLVAMQWVYNWDLGRYGTEFATARADYESMKAIHIVVFRDAGEKSGAMCDTRAEALPEVKAAHLRYRVAEQLERLARKRLDTITNQIEVWRSEEATQRKADDFQARQS